jgi:phosphotransferase system HPr (HPr) family protein
MPEITLTIRHQVGLHARPAATFVRTAKQFRSAVKVAHGEREANAKSILGILSLGAEQGAVITLRAEGEDADQALEALAALINGNFGEDR